MKIKVSTFLLLVLVVFAFGQQALWSTEENNKIKYIPYNNVTKEVLEFYDLYKFYFDFTGFNKEKFIEYFKGEEKDWNWIYDIREKAVFALRSPIEGGSAITVLCIDKDNFHMVVFSNVYDAGANLTYNGEMGKDRERFERWFKTLLNFTVENKPEPSGLSGKPEKNKRGGEKEHAGNRSTKADTTGL